MCILILFTDPVSDLFIVLTSPTISGRSVGIVRSQTKATELVISIIFTLNVFGSVINVMFALSSPTYCDIMVQRRLLQYGLEYRGTALARPSINSKL
jgi:hypothetical protein